MIFASLTIKPAIAVVALAVIAHDPPCLIIADGVTDADADICAAPFTTNSPLAESPATDVDDEDATASIYPLNDVTLLAYIWDLPTLILSDAVTIEDGP